MGEWDKWIPLTRVRPTVVSTLLMRLFAPVDRRRILSTTDGVKIYADPLSCLGETIWSTNTFEAETAAIFREFLRPGMAMLDVGANEGYFSVLAGMLCGPSGRVIAVEPQRRLQDLIEINSKLNGVSCIRVFQNGLGGDEGTQAVINLYPDRNNGASSVVSKHRFASETQTFEFVSFATLLAAAERSCFDLVKVDVEGFEPEVVRHVLPHVRQGQIRTLLLDYHEAILQNRGIDSHAIHASLLEAGMRVERGDTTRFSGYVLYSTAAQD